MHTEEIDLGDAEQALADLEAAEHSFGTSLPFSYFEKRTNKTTLLVANSGNTKPIDGKYRWFEYKFSQKVFVTKVEIETVGYKVAGGFEYKVVQQGGRVISGTFSPDSKGVLRLIVNDLVESINFRPPRNLLKKQILSVDVSGFGNDGLQDLLNIAHDLEGFRETIVETSKAALAKAEAANVKIVSSLAKEKELTEEIANKEGINSAKASEITKLNEQRKQISAQVTERMAEIGNLEGRLDDSKELLDSRQFERSELLKSIEKAKVDLKALQDDINMFPVELSEFVSQGAQSIYTYIKLAAVPIVILVIMFGLLLARAADLTSALVDDPEARIGAILLSRMPYALLAGTIVAACYGLASIAIKEIVRINKQRLDLSKLSIIAKDVSAASSEGLAEMSDIELIEIRNKVKMALLRDHMKTYITTEFKMPKLGMSNLLPDRKAEGDESTQVSDVAEENTEGNVE